MKASGLRRLVLLSWLAGLGVCALIFIVEALVPIHLDRRPVFNSALIFFGFFAPQFTMLLSFFLSVKPREEPDVHVEARRAAIIGTMSILYQIILVALVLAAVFNGLTREPDMIRSTSLAVSIAGLLSFLGLVPLSVLFKN